MTTTVPRNLAVLMLIVGISLAAAAPSTQARRIVCWKNNEGVRECANAVPPEYAQKSVERKSSMGLTIEKTERAKTEQELEQRRIDAERLRVEKAEQDRLRAEQKRRDRVLLQTFTTEEDLKLARDGKIAALDSRVKHREQLVEKFERTRDEMQGEAAQIERGGKKASADLHKKINDVQAQIGNTLAQIEQRNKERVHIQQQFESDLARYRELKGG